MSESTGFTQSPTSYETTSANNAMLARYSAHHEPFYRALRAHKMPIGSADRGAALDRLGDDRVDLVEDAGGVLEDAAGIARQG